MVHFAGANTCNKATLKYEQELRGYLDHIKVSAGSIQVYDVPSCILTLF